MTDEEIIKILECCYMENCNNCPMPYETCTTHLAEYALNLINGQKSEIDRLKNDIFCIANERDTWKDTVNTTADEAIKEFAEKLKEELTGWVERPTDLEIKYVIEEMAKEMVGAE